MRRRQGDAYMRDVRGEDGKRSISDFGLGKKEHKEFHSVFQAQEKHGNLFLIIDVSFSEFTDEPGFFGS